MRSALVLVFVAACGPSTTEPNVTPPDATATSTVTASVSPVATASTAAAPPAASSSAPATTIAPAPARDLVDLAEQPYLAEPVGFVRAKDWSKARKSLYAAQSTLKKSGRADDWMVVHALLGRTYAAVDNNYKALEMYRVVIATYRGKETLDTLGPSGEPMTVARTRLVIEARSEALFFEAEQKRVAMEKASRSPTYRGDGSKDDVTKFITGPFAAWMKERRVAIQETEQSYLAVVSVEPFPSPAFVVRSAERVGAMWAGFTRDIARAPMPDAWKGEGSIGSLPKAQIRATYEDALNDVLQPMLQHARAAYKHCVDKAQRFAITSEAASACAKWLEENPAPSP